MCFCVIGRRTSWIWRCAFVACPAWRRLCGTCLWRKSGLKAITFIAALSVPGWSPLPRLVPVMHVIIRESAFLILSTIKYVFLCRFPVCQAEAAAPIYDHVFAEIQLRLCQMWTIQGDRTLCLSAHHQSATFLWTGTGKILVELSSLYVQRL